MFPSSFRLPCFSLTGGVPWTCGLFLILILFIIHLIISFGKFEPPYLGNDYSSRKSSAIQSYKFMRCLFVFSVIHRTPRWKTGSLTCVRDHSYACVYTPGGWLGTPTVSQHNICDSEKLSQIFIGTLHRVRGLRVWRPFSITPAMHSVFGG